LGTDLQGAAVILKQNDFTPWLRLLWLFSILL